MARQLLQAFAIMAVLGVWVSAQQAPAEPAVPGPQRPNTAISGVWDYNAALSVDAATGRPEQAPQSATQRPRRGLPESSSVTGSGITNGPTAGPSAASGGSLGGSVEDFERNAMAAVIAERRALVRDLLEVPEMLRIRVTTDGVIFTDDLLRERTYLANGKMQKYQIGAARFEARAYWDAGQFRKDIEGSNNFKMSELYLLSDDGRRLHVVVRLGDPKKPQTIVGVNRVYDRIDK